MCVNMLMTDINLLLHLMTEISNFYLITWLRYLGGLAWGGGGGFDWLIIGIGGELL
jgi:hypothetical protein